MAPSSFASALAGSGQNDSSTRESSSEWSRRTNGATHTFRRSSTAVSSSSAVQAQDQAAPPSGGGSAARYVPPHRNGPSAASLAEMRYSKDQLLDLFRAQSGADAVARGDLSAYYVGSWRPNASNGGSSRADQSRDAQLGPDICWDRDGSLEPLGIMEMDDDEREIFLSSVKTPLKPPSATKENHQSNGLGGRKFSITTQGGSSANPGPLSPTATRGSVRRRETSESFPFSATSGREEQRAPSPPPSLLRRTTDAKDASRPSDHDESDEKAGWSPFGTLKRNATGPLGSGIGGPTSPWSNTPSGSGLPPMGSFGNFGLSQQGTAGEKRPGLGSGRSESRFKNLLSRDSTDDAAPRPPERKGSISGLGRVNENDSWRPSHDRGERSLDEADEDLPTGSAALAADPESSPPLSQQANVHGFGTPGRGEHREDFAFGAFGMTSDNTLGFGSGFPQGRDAFGTGQSQGRQIGGHEPMSPTDTNPYQSPEQHGLDRLTDEEHAGADMHNQHLGGLGGFGADAASQFASLGGLGALPNLGRGPAPGADRSQTSSAGPNRGFPTLGGLGQLGGMPGAGGWPLNQNGLGTPTRQTAALPSPFGSGLFGSDVQQPTLAGLGSAGGFGGGRMASMFPPTMQDQMNQGDQDRSMSARLGQQHFQGLGEHHRDPTGQFSAQGFPPAPPSADEASGQQSQAGAQPSQLEGSGHHQSASQSISQQLLPPGSASNQPPQPQQRTMVMPDRMRWIYRDPQGQTQGPWSGLEMHDWYKAGFFSPELLVKKLEEPEYEPLAQLIRRIGNSREPFLVPQIGIPHGQASNNGPNAWASAGSIAAGPAPSAGAQPPFASSFPSFGTTLTAEQQNALERRKQEEQYLMARQKEHLAQAQMAQRMQHHPMQSGGIHPGLAPVGQLHHQHSGQSLHTQPSFGSMTSPTSGGYQPSPIQAPQGHGQGQGFFDNSFRTQGSSAGLGAIGGSASGAEGHGHVRDDEIPGLMNRLSVGNRGAPGQLGAGGQQQAFPSQQGAPQSSGSQELREQQVQQMMQDRARIQLEQAMHDAQAKQTEDDQGERLTQFQQLQEQDGASGVDSRFQQTTTASAKRSKHRVAGELSIPAGQSSFEQHEPAHEELSLTEQVQKAASAQQSPVPPHPGFPQPFPPAPSQSPLPAPAAQRTGRQSVADQLQSEQRDSSQTPSVETPSAMAAPWAKDQAEAPKGPSLKEIQEIEAKRAAELEEIASAARRAAFQKEMELQAQAQAQAALAASAQVLPAGAKWATAGGSPVTPTSGAAWVKAAQKPSGPTTAKTMAQIQKEEEARKKKAAAAAAAALATQGAAAASAAPIAGGKSYANLAGKASASSPTPPAAGGAWTTVGASGKTKPPVTATAAPTRTVSSSATPTVATSAAPRKGPTRSVTMGGSGAANAQDEFKKWAVGELRPDLNKGISAEEFVAGLVFLPPDTEIITEAVHAVSSTIDSRHFAEEFVRRKRLADKGLVDSSIPPKSASPHNAAASASAGGGWSEVAKKNPARDAAAGSGAAGSSRDDANGNFRVVAAKKKGGKR